MHSSRRISKSSSPDDRGDDEDDDDDDDDDDDNNIRADRDRIDVLKPVGGLTDVLRYFAIRMI